MFYKEHSKELVDKIFIIIYCCLTVILKFINLEQQTSQWGFVGQESEVGYRGNSRKGSPHEFQSS